MRSEDSTSSAVNGEPRLLQILSRTHLSTPDELALRLNALKVRPPEPPDFSLAPNLVYACSRDPTPSVCAHD